VRLTSTLACFLLCIAAAGASPPRLLLTDYLANPLGIDSAMPGFSWQMQSTRRGAVQTAYQVQVASSKARLAAGKPDMWDSGKVKSRQPVAVVYDGKPLKSRAAYAWRVRVWDEHGTPGEFSQPASFETALLSPKNWSARWVSVPSAGGNGYHSEFGSDVNDTKWVQVDLGKPVSIASIVFYPARPFNFQRDDPGFGFPVRYRIEASDSADFASSRVISDRTAQDQPNPGANPVTISISDQIARYVRVVATKLDQPNGAQPLFALAEMEVLDSRGVNLAFRAPVQAHDSIEQFDWGTRLLTDGDRLSHVPNQVSPLARREFDVNKPVARARAYVTGLGYCELRLNGAKVGDRVLDPPRTDYTKRVCYSTYDVTNSLVRGRNCVGVMLGRGWWTDSPRFLVQLVIDFTDGSSKRVVSDASWRWSDGPILENSLYNGETLDARKEPRGWDKPGFDESKWKPVIPFASDVALSAEMIQPIKVVETLAPKAITSPAPGFYVVDFGQNFSGWCRISLSAPAGTRITLKHAELLHPDGTVNQENLRSARATDVFVTAGTGKETYEPRFTYHGFRYVQVEGWPGVLTSDAIQGRVVCTALDARGTFACSNDLLNKIQHNAWWGERTNFHSIPTDCPQRDERQGWMGDAWMSSDAMYHNFDMAPAYAKFLRDIADAEGTDGSVPDTVPHVWGGQNGDPMWSAAYPVILWETYLHTGDKRILAEHYDGVKRFVDLLHGEAKDLILTQNTYGDWIAIEGTPKELISTGTFCWLSGMVADMAEALGKREDARTYRELRKSIGVAFNARFFDDKTGSYGNGSQFSDAFPLALGIVPTDKLDQVTKSLVDGVEAKHGGHLSTGFIGTPFLLDALVREGRADLAYRIVTQKTFPGWGYMVANGATTTWELWQLATGNGMNSHNHPALGFISAWFYQTLAGLVPDPKNAGWERFTVKPYVLGDLKWARASVQTLRGKVESDWRLTASGISLSVTVPANSTATVCVPKLNKKNCSVSEGKSDVWKAGAFQPSAKGVRSARDGGEWIDFEVTSGHYAFTLAGH
jgi:alpha-L-rhamnosidase